MKRIAKKFNFLGEIFSSFFISQNIKKKLEKKRIEKLKYLREGTMHTQHLQKSIKII